MTAVQPVHLRQRQEEGRAGSEVIRIELSVETTGASAPVVHFEHFFRLTVEAPKPSQPSGSTQQEIAPLRIAITKKWTSHPHCSKLLTS